MAAMRSTIAARCGRDLGPLADDRDVDRGNGAASRTHEIGGVAQELVRRGAAPARVARREMHADVAGADRAEHRVGQRVQSDIGIGMSGKAHAVRDRDTAYPEMIARGEGVHVEALADADIALPGGEEALGRGKVLRSRNLQIVLAAVDDQRRQPRCLGDCGVVGQLAADRGAVGGEDRTEVKALRRLCSPQSGTVDRLANHPALGALDRVAQGQAGDRRDRLVQTIEDPVDELLIGKRSRPIVNQYALRAIGGQCFEAEPHRVLARRASGDRRHHS